MFEFRDLFPKLLLKFLELSRGGPVLSSVVLEPASAILASLNGFYLCDFFPLGIVELLGGTTGLLQTFHGQFVRAFHLLAHI